MARPTLIVYSSLFPSAAAPIAGSFIKERMFRVAKQLPLAVVSPQPYSPLDWMIRLVRKSFRPRGARFEMVEGIEVHRPRYLSLPGLGKRFDGASMAWCTRGCVRELSARLGANLIDAHFLYPDGYAATLIARSLGLPVTITLRGSKDENLIGTSREPFLVKALKQSTALFAVSESLKTRVGIRLGTPANKIKVIGNGVDLDKFTRVDRAQARERLGLDPAAPVLIGVGSLVEGKGFQRVIPLLPALRKRHPGLIYLVVGGGASHGDLSRELLALAATHGVEDAVKLCGRQLPQDLKWYYSAADVFVLATRYEGWANVFLEAMAFGLPVVSTQVGGNAEVVPRADLGTLVPFWDPAAFEQAIDEALTRVWDRAAIEAYARANSWDGRIAELVAEFSLISARADGSDGAGRTRGVA